MTPSNDQVNKNIPIQPSLESLMAGYLRRQAESRADGLISADLGSEVVLHDAGPVQPVDARAAWEEALAATRLLCPAAKSETWKVPPHWPQLVAQQEPVMAVPLGIGNFPQLVRSLQPLMQKANLTELRPVAGRPVPAPALVEWADDVTAKRQYPQALLAAGALRLARLFDKADEVLAAMETVAPKEWAGVVTNEKAVLAWHRGRAEEARSLWKTLPASGVLVFNRGLAALFCGEPKSARAPLTESLGHLPEGSGWHHLARFYLTLAEMRS